MNSSRIVLAASLLLAFEASAHAQAIDTPIYPHLPGFPAAIHVNEATEMQRAVLAPRPDITAIQTVSPPYPESWTEGYNAYVDQDNNGIDFGTLLSNEWTTDCSHQSSCLKEDAAVGFTVVAPQTGTLNLWGTASVEWFFHILPAAWPWDGNGVTGKVTLYVEDLANLSGTILVWDKLYDAQATGYNGIDGSSQPSPDTAMSLLDCVYNNPYYRSPLLSNVHSQQAFWGCDENNNGMLAPVTNAFVPVGPSALVGTVPVVQGHPYIVWIWSSIDGHLGPTGGARNVLWTNVGTMSYWFS